MAATEKSAGQASGGDAGDGDLSSPPQRFTIDILHTIKSAQNSNGLRMAANYRRYRQYCTRRLRRLRKCKKMRFMYAPKSGRGFNKREVTSDIVDDLRYMYLPLISAERAWSYARELKAESDDHPRKFHHMRRRLKKAAAWAKKLQELCQVCGDDRTALEAQAYASWMHASYLLECEDWEGSLKDFQVAREIYAQLSRVGTLDQKEMFSERVAEIEPSMGFCKFNIGIQTNGDATSAEERERALREMKGNASAGSADLQAKIYAVLAQTRRQQAEKTDSVSWLGTQLPLRSEAVRTAIVKVHDAVFSFEEQAKELESREASQNRVLKEKNSQGNIQAVDHDEKAEMETAAREETFLALMSAFDAASQAVRADVRKAKKRGEQKAGMLLKELDAMRSWCKYNKTRHMLTRTEERTRALSSPGDLVKMFDSLMQHTADAKAIPGVEDNPEVVGELAALEAGFRAKRCFHMARKHASTEDPLRMSEAFVLFQHTVKLAGDAARYHKARSGISDIGDCARSIADGISDAEALISEAERERSRLAAEYTLANAKHNSIGVVTNTNRPLMARLHDFDSGVADDLNMISIPPAPTAITCKPLFFDTASRGLALPNVDDRVKETKSEGGFLSAVGGFFS